MYKFLILLIIICTVNDSFAQHDNYIDKHIIDSLKIADYENDTLPVKVLHAEPLYIDLIRDLGARKGEKEWNVGLGITDNLTFDTYEALVEYEWAVADRLGLEVEIPFLIYSGQKGVPSDSIPSDRMESLKLAAQWSFYVNQSISTSMALGYINELEFTEFQDFGNPLLKGNIYNPFFVVAKRWGTSFHTLIYTGPMIEQKFNSNEWESSYEINTNFHYMVPGTSNFIGVELNKSIESGDFDMTIRPQMRVDISDEILIGIVTGFPISRENERLSAFLRIIYEPRGQLLK